MKYIDDILFQINHHAKAIELVIPKKDKRILLSLSRQLSSGVFLTENQGNLLVKILKENLIVFQSIFPQIDDLMLSPQWSKDFRILQKYKKIYINPEFPTTFVVEFSFNARLKEKMVKISSSIKGIMVTKGSKFVIPLNEFNIQLVVSTFGRENFSIDEKIMDFFKEIEEIKEHMVNPFNIFSTDQEKIKKSVITDIKDISIDNLLLLQDRKLRYQYEISEPLAENSLVDKIANRPHRKIHLNSNTINLNDVFDSLLHLHRFPILVVFDGHSSLKDRKTLKLLENSIAFKNLGQNIGIYFRYDKENDRDLFNYELSTLGYNKNLTSATTIAGISNSKLPKFMLKTDWKPQAVISFTNSFRSNKTSVYCADIDLIIYYTPSQPLSENIYAIM